MPQKRNHGVERYGAQKNSSALCDPNELAYVYKMGFKTMSTAWADAAKLNILMNEWYLVSIILKSQLCYRSVNMKGESNLARNAVSLEQEDKKLNF